MCDGRPEEDLSPTGLLGTEPAFEDSQRPHEDHVCPDERNRDASKELTGGRWYEVSQRCRFSPADNRPGLRLIRRAREEIGANQPDFGPKSRKNSPYSYALTFCTGPSRPKSSVQNRD